MNATANPAFPQFVSAGDILTDLIRTGPSDWLSRPGGAGWNVARAVARLGLPTASAGSLGTDNFSDELWDASVAAGLDMRFMQRVERPPLLAIVHKTQPPTYYFMGENGADLAFNPALLPSGWIDAVKWAHFGCISLVRQPLGDTLAQLAAQLREHGVKISFDPNYRNLMEHGYEPTLRKMAALADLIKVSDEDLQRLFPNIANEADAIAEIRAMNPQATVLVTRGSSEATLHVGDKSWQATPPKVQVADTVGAGDASIGGLLYSLMTRAGGWPDHLRFALAAGAAACRMSGAHSPSLEEVEDLLA
ncbi:sugar kinase [Burkholderia sp. Leaf177]|uniref:carbohydrate kinase family protein n=1 Tax=Burkholderia sp. Leaf177 TaxID=1736287 RepID=UPI0006F8402A|nr:carbohydrate kinase [Burkholderia sp. Leaf177]KQR79635.1 sugar kinase [Burkholderia sp. Leaf177]